MLFINQLQVACLNMYGRIATWKQEPASPVHNPGYGYDYSKTDD